MKKKILSISSPTNTVEEQKAENAKLFGENLSKLAYSESYKPFLGMLSIASLGGVMGSLTYTGANITSIDPNLAIPAGITLLVSSTLFFISDKKAHQRLNNLAELYEKKGNEEQIIEPQQPEENQGINGRTM